jgi:hypothetical protein
VAILGWDPGQAGRGARLTNCTLLEDPAAMVEEPRCPHVRMEANGALGHGTQLDGQGSESLGGGGLTGTPGRQPRSNLVIIGMAAQATLGHRQNTYVFGRENVLVASLWLRKRRGSQDVSITASLPGAHGRPNLPVRQRAMTHGVFRGNPDGAVDGHPAASPHGDPIHPGYLQWSGSPSVSAYSHPF